MIKLGPSFQSELFSLVDFSYFYFFFHHSINFCLKEENKGNDGKSHNLDQTSNVFKMKRKRNTIHYHLFFNLRNYQTKCKQSCWFSEINLRRLYFLSKPNKLKWPSAILNKYFVLAFLKCGFDECRIFKSDFGNNLSVWSLAYNSSNSLVCCLADVIYTNGLLSVGNQRNSYKCGQIKGFKCLLYLSQFNEN